MTGGRGRAWRAALLLAALAGTFVCLFHPEPFPSDEDEAFQLRMIDASPSDFSRMLARDAVHPPLDYLVDRFVERSVPGSARRRVAPAAWGFLAVLAFGALLGSRVGRFAGIAGAALFALALYRVSEARRLRPYSLGLLLLLASLFFLEAWLSRPSALRLAAAFAAAVGAVWTLYLAGAVLAVAATALVVEDRLRGTPARRTAARGLLRRWPLFAAAALAAAAPLAPLLRAVSRQPSPVPAPPLSFGRWARIVSYAAYSPNAGYGFPPRWLFLIGFAAALAAIAGGAIAAARTAGARFLLGWAAGGILIVEIVKRVHPHWDSFRYFLPAVVAATGLEAVALHALWARGRRGFAVAALAALLLFDAPSYVRFYRYGVWDFSSGRRRSGPIGEGPSSSVPPRRPETEPRAGVSPRERRDAVSAPRAPAAGTRSRPA